MSTKRMHPPVALQAAAQTGVKGALLSSPITACNGKPANCSSTIITKDRHNVENIVPSQKGTKNINVEMQNPVNSTENVNGLQGAVRKSNHRSNTIAASKMQSSSSVPASSSAISTLNSTNRRKNNRVSSPNRKRQEQQTIFNSLKSWHVKLVPSVNAQQDKRDAGTAEIKGENASSLPAVATSGCNEAGKANSENSVATCTSISTSIVSSNTSINSNISNNGNSSSSNSSGKSSKKKDYPLMIAATAGAVVSKEKETTLVAAQTLQKPTTSGGGSESTKPGSISVSEPVKEAYVTSALPSGPDSRAFGGTTATTKGQKKLLNGSGSFSTYHRHPASLLSPNAESTVGSIIPSTTPSASSVPSVTPPILQSSAPVASSATAPTVVSAKAGVNVSNNGSAGKVLLPNVNSLDHVNLIQGKLRGSLKLENFVTPPPQTHHISHHSTIPLHHTSGQTHLVPQQQQPQIPPTTPPHYSLDFLHYVGMRMSTTNGAVQSGNPTSTASTAIFRASPHFNYTFNQQLHQQQQQILHQQMQQQQQQPRQQHVQRHYYDEVLIQTSAAGDTVFTSYSVPAEHLANGGNAVNGNTSIGINGGDSNDTSLNYYPQNQHHLQHNHPTQQSSYGQHHQNQYHNNNYQQHNRNYGRGTQHSGSGNLPNGGKRSWNNNWHNSKRGNLLHGGKFGNKNSNFNHGYRKNHHFYNSHHNNHQQQYEQFQGHQFDNSRNLVYIRGYDRCHRTSGSHKSASRSPTPSPQSASPVTDSGEAVELNAASVLAQRDEKCDSGIDELVQCLKNCAVPSSSSSSSSMASIPSTDSSAVSSSVSQGLEIHCGTGPGYESDSSHSSSYNSHTYRHRKYANGGQVYRSSSSTSSGVSSTAAFPPISTATTTTPQVTDFFLRSQSYHGSQQNLVTVSGGASPNPPSSPGATPRSLIGTQSVPMFSELFTGTHHHFSHQQQSHSVQTQPSLQNATYGSNNSLELTLQSGTGASPANSNVSNGSISSCGYSSAPSSTVPPNEVYSMQSGHPKRRNSGRTSPVPFANCSKPNRSSSGNVLNANAAPSTSAQQQQQPQPKQAQNQQPPCCSSPPAVTCGKNTSVWNQHRSLTDSDASVIAVSKTQVSHALPTFPPPTTTTLTSFPPPNEGSNFHTPADKFLARAHLVEMLAPPEDAVPPAPKYASLSDAIWKKFAAVQQTQNKFVQKIHLWRYLFTCIRKAFPRFSLYLVGSTISGFAADSSDVDMCLVYRCNTVPYDMRGEALCQLGQLKNYFMNIGTCFEEFSVIQAKVPILRFRDTTNSIVVDLNYNNCVGVRNTHLLQCYSQLDWRVRPLALVVKMWAQHHNINDAKNMTISSYSLVLMVIHFLQYGVSPPILPCLHAMYPDKFVRISDISTIDLTERMEPYKNENTMSLGELFLLFLEYYANFDYTHYAISVRTASIIPIESARAVRSYKNDPHHWRQLCIEEPFDLTNTARSVFDGEIFEQIKAVFSTSWRRVDETNDINSVFDCEPLFVPVASALSLTS